MAALQTQQLQRLCSTTETFERAQSILRLATAKTRPGSGFVIKQPAALPAICAFLASEQLNTSEVSLKSAKSAACVNQTEFSDILKKVRAALGSEESNAVTDVTYETLVDAYNVYPREDAIACMEDAEGALQRVEVLKDRYGANTMTCAVFYWVCQLMEETSVQERQFRQAYSLPPKPFKAAVAMLDKQCDGVAEQIKTHLLQQRNSVQASTSSQPHRAPRPNPTSPPKSPMKSAIKLQRNASTPTVTPSKKRTVAFTRLSSEGHDNNSLPETPTKKRRTNSLSPTKPTTTNNPFAQGSSTAGMAAFHAALKGSPAKLPEDASLAAGPSTPRHPRRAAMSEAFATPTRPDPQPSPSRSQGQRSPTRPAVRRRFRPVFLEQQQWYARDPKVEQMWAAAETLWNEMAAQHGPLFQGISESERVGVSVA